MERVAIGYVKSDLFNTVPFGATFHTSKYITLGSKDFNMFDFFFTHTYIIC